MNESGVIDTETPIQSDVVSATSDEAPQGSAAEVPESNEANSDKSGPFPIEMFPPELAAYAKALSEDTGFDIAGIAATMLSISAGIVGKSRKVKVKPGWVEPCALWSAVIGNSGSGKSVVLKALKEYAEETDINLREMREHVEREEADKRKQEAKKSKGEEDKTSRSPLEPSKPKPVLLSGDATWEKELMLIKESPNGLLKTHHEMKNWFEEMTKHNSDTSSYYCELYDGETVRQDRMERGCLIVKDALMSIASMVQPAVLAKVATPERWAQGLMPRFMLVYTPKQLKFYRECEGDEVYGTSCWREVQRLLYDLRDYEPVIISINREVEVDDKSAHDLFKEDYNQRERRKYNRDGVEEAITSKSQGWVIRIAGILCLWSQVLNPKYRGNRIITDRPIGCAHIRAAIVLGRWFEEESIRSSSKILEVANKQNSNTLAQWLAKHPDGATGKMLMDENRALYPKSEDANAALIRLVREGHAIQKPYKGNKGPQTYRFYLKS